MEYTRALRAHKANTLVYNPSRNLLGNVIWISTCKTPQWDMFNLINASSRSHVSVNFHGYGDGKWCFSYSGVPLSEHGYVFGIVYRSTRTT